MLNEENSFMSYLYVQVLIYTFAPEKNDYYFFLLIYLVRTSSNRKMM